MEKWVKGSGCGGVGGGKVGGEEWVERSGWRGVSGEEWVERSGWGGVGGEEWVGRSGWGKSG